MAIPTQTEMFPITLRHMADGETRKNKQIQLEIVESLGLTPEELALRTSTGVPAAQNRVGWSIQHLQRAKLLDRVSKGTYRITADGIKLSSENLPPAEFAATVRSRIAEMNPWKRSDGEDAEPDVAEEMEDISPQEAIDAAIRSLNSSLADQLIDKILSEDPAFFEKLIVDLLEKLGYGTGEVTQPSNDGGVDGIISTDSLGFDPIYTQAKRYSPDKTVGRPDVQKFAGALGRHTRGIFITTSTFAKNAYEFVETYPHATIILVDGRRLAQLMIDNDLGVSTERTYSLKRMDSDYFDGE